MGVACAACRPAHQAAVLFDKTGSHLVRDTPTHCTEQKQLSMELPYDALRARFSSVASAWQEPPCVLVVWLGHEVLSSKFEQSVPQVTTAQGEISSISPHY